jgi:chorismate dehydratase
MIKVSCVSYLNSKPFIYGLQNEIVASEIELSLDIPSVCADKLKSGEVDIGLVPVILIPELKEPHIISDFCIGAYGKVETVVLFSNVPLDKIETIVLDSQSRTSVILARILAAKFWKIHPEWLEAAGEPRPVASDPTAYVLIGDKTFDLKDKFRFEFDLAEEWKKFTTGTTHPGGLPFVFACWVANRPLPDAFLQDFNAALQYGLDHRDDLLPEFTGAFPGVDVHDYLFNKISYFLDAEKLKGMNLFLDYAGEIVATGKKN